MHSTTHTGDDQGTGSGALDFLWLELTNRCNLECVHCYADSSPQGQTSVLSESDYRRLLADAFALGCRRVQFIGGEPTLNRSLPKLISAADALGFEAIEVYTNLVHISDALLDCLIRHHVQVATSIYSNLPAVHDRVTARPGSWSKTVANLHRLVDAHVPVRASFIETDLNRGALDATRDWLHSIGITDVGHDRMRGFGRGAATQQCEMSELCGNCASGTLCIGPDGTVAPCIMSKAWPAGSVGTDTLPAIVRSERLRQIRQQIYEQTGQDRMIAMGGCNPDRVHKCGPDQGSTCTPCSPNTNCGPNDCRPKHSPPPKR